MEVREKAKVFETISMPQTTHTGSGLGGKAAALTLKSMSARPHGPKKSTTAGARKMTTASMTAAGLPYLEKAVPGYTGNALGQDCPM